MYVCERAHAPGGGPLMVSKDETIIFFVISINRVARPPFFTPPPLTPLVLYRKTGYRLPKLYYIVYKYIIYFYLLAPSSHPTWRVGGGRFARVLILINFSDNMVYCMHHTLQLHCVNRT